MFFAKEFFECALQRVFIYTLQHLFPARTQSNNGCSSHTIIAKENSYDGKNVFSSLCNNNCCTYASLHNVKYKPFTNNKHITYCKLCNKSLWLIKSTESSKFKTCSDQNQALINLWSNHTITQINIARSINWVIKWKLQINQSKL